MEGSTIEAMANAETAAELEEKLAGFSKEELVSGSPVFFRPKNG